MTPITQTDRWELHYNEIMQFMAIHQRRPSKHYVEEHRMLNWVKYNKKLMAKGELPADREQRFRDLLAKAQKLRRLNQYAYGMPRAERPALSTTLSLFSE